MDMTDEKKGWWMDRHITATWLGTIIIQTLVGLVWLTWIASGYTRDLTSLKDDMAEMRVEQRSLQASLVAQTALSDKRLALLESSLPELKQGQRELGDDLRELTNMLAQYLNGKAKTNGYTPQ